MWIEALHFYIVNKDKSVKLYDDTEINDRSLHHMSPEGIEERYVISSEDDQYVGLERWYYLHSKKVTKEKYRKAIHSYIIKVSGLLSCLGDIVTDYYLY